MSRNGFGIFSNRNVTRIRFKCLCADLGLKVKKTANIDWKPTAIKIKDALEHHIQNEESRIFSVARKIFSEEDAKMLGTAFEEMKSKVSSEGMQKSTFDFVVNLMPPRFVDKIKALNPISRPE